MPARPRMGLSAIPAGDTAGLFTMTMTAAAGIAFLAAVATPARGLPLELQPAAKARQQVFAAATKPKAKEEMVDEVTAKAKAAKEPFNVLISIDKQQLTLYSGTEVIARSRVSTGTASHPT